MLMLGVFITLTSMSSNGTTVVTEPSAQIEAVNFNTTANNPLVCVGNYCCTDTYCCNLRCDFGNCCFPIISTASGSNFLSFGAVETTPVNIPMSAIASN